MTAQIRPNRMEVSDRFPMLGFSVRTDQPDLEAEVVIASDIGLFSPQNRTRRTAANFYSSREHGILSVPRGEGVFVVPPDVLARFIGIDKLYFGLATGRTGNGGLKVDALPREGSPYVSLRGFTGRTLRRGFGGARASTIRLDWTGDAPLPGSEAANGAAPVPPSANGNARPAVPVPYDDGFGPMPGIPARESAYRGRGAGTSRRYRGLPFTAAHQLGLPRGTTAITMSSGTTAEQALAWIREKAEAVVDAVGNDVSPPSLYRLGGNSATFISAWETVLGAAGWIPGSGAIYGFLKTIPALARSSGVTLSIGPALDTPLFGGGVGVVFAPDGQVALFGQGEISVDFEGLSEFVTSLKATLQAKLKLGYNNGGIDGFASLAKVASIAVGEEIVVGAEVWLDSNGSGLGGAVSVGVGFALQLSAGDRRQRRGVPFVAARQLGLPANRTAITMSSGTTPQGALAWIREKVEAVVDAVGDDVSPPSLHRLGSDSATFISAWETVLGAASWLPGTGGIYGFLKEIPAAARATGVTLSIGPALDTPLFGGGIGVVFAPDGEVALFGQGEISVDFEGLSEFVSSLKASLQAKLKLGYNNRGIDGFASLAKVASVAVGEEIVVGAEVWLDSAGSGLGGAVSIGVGFALQLSGQEAGPAAVMPVLPGDARGRAQRIGGQFGARIGEALDLGLDAATLNPLLDRLESSARPQPLFPAAEAKPLGLARPFNTAPWSIQWDGVDLIPQPTGNSCWATTLSMLMGWRDQKSYPPATIAGQCGKTINEGLPWAQRATVAGQLGLGTEAPACYTPEGFAGLIEGHGPLYVGKIMSDQISSGHAVLVTGMYFDGTSHFLRIADPWDRGAGAPGAPDPYGATHATGSRYIMGYETFQAEYEMAADGNPAYVQIIHGGVPMGRTINRDLSPPRGYAQAAPHRRAQGASARRVPAAVLTAGPGVGAQIAAEVGKIVVGEIVSSTGTDITYQVDEYKGWHRPPQLTPQSPLNAVEESTAEIEWDDGGILSKIGLKLRVSWEHDGWSVGKVLIVPYGFNDAWGDELFVRVQIRDVSRPFHGTNPSQFQTYMNNPGAMLELTITYRRGRLIRDDVVEGKKIYLLPTGQYTETEMALD